MRSIGRSTGHQFSQFDQNGIVAAAQTIGSLVDVVSDTASDNGGFDHVVGHEQSFAKALILLTRQSHNGINHGNGLTVVATCSLVKEKVGVDSNFNDLVVDTRKLQPSLSFVLVVVVPASHKIGQRRGLWCPKMTTTCTSIFGSFIFLHGFQFFHRRWKGRIRKGHFREFLHIHIFGKQSDILLLGILQIFVIFYGHHLDDTTIFVRSRGRVEFPIHGLGDNDRGIFFGRVRTGNARNADAVHQATSFFGANLHGFQVLGLQGHHGPFEIHLLVLGLVVWDVLDLCDAIGFDEIGFPKRFTKGAVAIGRVAALWSRWSAAFFLLR